MMDVLLLLLLIFMSCIVNDLIDVRRSSFVVRRCRFR